MDEWYNNFLYQDNIQITYRLIHIASMSWCHIRHSLYASVKIYLFAQLVWCYRSSWSCIAMYSPVALSKRKFKPQYGQRFFFDGKIWSLLSLHFCKIDKVWSTELLSNTSISISVYFWSNTLCNVARIYFSALYVQIRTDTLVIYIYSNELNNHICTGLSIFFSFHQWLFQRTENHISWPISLSFCWNPKAEQTGPRSLFRSLAPYGVESNLYSNTRLLCRPTTSVSNHQ